MTFHISHTYVAEMPIAEGIDIMLNVNGRKRKYNSSSARQLYLRDYAENGKISCFACGCVADRWIITKYTKQGHATLSLFGRKGDTLVQFSRDHIIPRCFGGKDALRNLRAACEPCNKLRSDEMTKADKAFLVKNFDLVCPNRAKAAIARRITALATQKSQQIKITQIKSMLKFSCYISGHKVPDTTPFAEIWS